MNTHKVALAVGTFAGLWHLAWSLLIAFGLAEPLLNFIFALHSLNNPYILQPFNLGRSVGLILLTSILGYVAGTIFASIWNSIHGRI